MKKKWFENKRHEIQCLENGEHGVINLSAKEVNGKWEYAIVLWKYQIPNLLYHFCDGKMIELED